MDAFFRYLEDAVASHPALAIAGLATLLGAIVGIFVNLKKIWSGLKATFDFIKKVVWPRLPGFWKTIRPAAIIFAFLAALIFPVGYAIWYFLFLSVTHISQISERSTFLSLFFQEAILVVVYCMAWAVAAHFWLLPWLFRRKDPGGGAPRAGVDHAK